MAKHIKPFPPGFHPITWRNAIGTGLLAIALAATLILLAGCEILPSSRAPASYGTGPMAIKYLQHSTTATRGIVVIEVAGFTQEAYHLSVQTKSRSQSNGPGAWFVPYGKLTTIEVMFRRDQSGAPDVVTIMLENDFDELAPEYSRAVIEVTYQ